MASANALSGLIKFINRTDWSSALDDVLAQHLEPACKKFGIAPDELDEILGQGHGMTLWGCALEDFMTREYEGAGNVVDEYLRRRGYAESGGAKRYIQALRRAVMSLYEVSDVVPGKSFLARDLIRGGDPVRVTERSGTKTLKAWDRIAARLVRVGSEWWMSGGVLLFDRQASEFVINALTGFSGRPPDELREGAARIFTGVDSADIDRHLAEGLPPRFAGPLITGIWLSNALQQALNPQRPQLVNRDRHPIVMCTSTFPLREGALAAQCRTALIDVPGFYEEDDTWFKWIRDDGDETSAKPSPETETSAPAPYSNNNTVLGSIAIKDGAVVLSTNSRERASSGEAIIAGALGALVDEATREEMTAEQMREEKAHRPPEPAPRAVLPPEEERAIVHACLEQHYRKTLDQPIPALGGVSPRDAVRSEAGRAKVAAWLKDMENHAAKARQEPLASYDLGWMWRELGLVELRV